MQHQTPMRQVRARFDADTLTVYQAYGPEIAEPALAAGRFIPPFKPTRMTWIKPSFLWMMYRCGWATKPGQERVLAITIRRDAFEDALRHSCPSHLAPDSDMTHDQWRERLAASPVRIQWDPERTPTGEPLPWRSLQVGLGPAIAPAYASDWITAITDLTPHLPRLREPDALREHLAHERPYPLPDDVRRTINASCAGFDDPGRAYDPPHEHS